MTMEPDKHLTKVIFRRFRNGDIIALFPELAGSNAWSQDCNSYMHVGQHGTASVFIVRDTWPASPKQYESLKQELGNIGYRLQVVKRFTPRHTEARRKAVYRNQ